jgi:hypothetical protein
MRRLERMAVWADDPQVRDAVVVAVGHEYLSERNRRTRSKLAAEIPALASHVCHVEVQLLDASADVRLSTEPSEAAASRKLRDATIASRSCSSVHRRLRLQATSISIPRL